MSVHAIGKNFLTNAAGIVILRLGTLGLLALYTRYLNAEEYGLYALVQLYVLTLSPLVISSTSGAVQRLSVDYQGDEQRLLIGNVAIVLFAAGTVVLAAVSLWGAPLVRSLFDVHDHESVRLFLLGQFALYPFLFASLHTAVFQAEGRPGRIVRVQTLQATALLLFGLYCVGVRGGGTPGAVQALVLGSWAMVPLILWDLRGRVQLRPRIAMLRVITAFSLPVVPYVALSLAKDSIDRVVLAHLIGLDGVGLYAVALMLGTACGLVVSSYYAAFGPAIFRIYKDNGPAAGRRLIRQRAMQGLALVSSGFVGLSLFADEVTALLADQAYRDAARLVPLVAGAFLVRYVWLLFYYHIMHLHLTRLLPLISAAGLAVTAGLALVLTPRLGPAGAAVGLIGGFLAMALSGGYLCYRHHYLRVIEWGKAFVLIGAAVAAVTAGLLPPYPDEVTALAAKGLAGAAFLLMAWRLGPFELDALFRRITAARSRRGTSEPAP